MVPEEPELPLLDPAALLPLEDDEVPLDAAAEPEEDVPLAPLEVDDVPLVPLEADEDVPLAPLEDDEDVPLVPLEADEDVPLDAPVVPSTADPVVLDPSPLTWAGG